MEEADQLLLRAARQLGCDIPDDVVSCRDLASNHLVQATAFLLNRVAGTNIPAQLPDGVAARHRFCTNLGKRIKELGYTGETGFNQFLYPTEKDARALLMFIVSKAPPKEQEDERSAVTGETTAFEQRFVSALDEWSKQRWVPQFSDSVRPAGYRRYAITRFSTVELDLPGVDKAAAASESSDYMDKYLAYVTSQARTPAIVAASIQHRNSCGIAATEYQGEAASSSEGKAQAEERLAAIKRRALTAASSGSTSTLGAGGPVGAASGQALRDLMEGYRGQSSATTGQRSAFALATEFGQEKTLPTDAALLGATLASGVGGAGKLAASAPGASPSGDAATLAVKDEATLAAERELQLQQLRDAILEAEKSTARQQKSVENETQNVRQITAALNAERAKTAEMERSFMLKKQTLGMLPNAPQHLAELNNICVNSAAKLMALAAEWETHRKPRVEAVRMLQEARAKRREDCKRKVVEMKAMRTAIQDMAEEIKAKEQQADLLQRELDALPKDLSRSMYTYRIMDIVKQIRKQSIEISKIIATIRDVQSEINTVTAKLQRTTALADEQLFQAARAQQAKDTPHAQAYRQLVSIRETFELLRSTVQSIAKVENSQRDLESKHSALQSSMASQHASTLAGDLKQIQKENAALAAQLKALQPR